MHLCAYRTQFLNAHDSTAVMSCANCIAIVCYNLNKSQTNFSSKLNRDRKWLSKCIAGAGPWLLSACSQVIPHATSSMHDDVIKWKFSALLTLCAGEGGGGGNPPSTGEFSSQWPVTRSIDVFGVSGWRRSHKSALLCGALRACSTPICNVRTGVFYAM